MHHARAARAFCLAVSSSICRSPSKTAALWALDGRQPSFRPLADVPSRAPSHAASMRLHLADGAMLLVGGPGGGGTGEVWTAEGCSRRARFDADVEALEALEALRTPRARRHTHAAAATFSRPHLLGGGRRRLLFGGLTTARWPRGRSPDSAGGEARTQAMYAAAAGDVAENGGSPSRMTSSCSRAAGRASGV